MATAQEQKPHARVPRETHSASQPPPPTERLLERSAMRKGGSRSGCGRPRVSLLMANSPGVDTVQGAAFRAPAQPRAPSACPLRSSSPRSVFTLRPRLGAGRGACLPLSELQQHKDVAARSTGDQRAERLCSAAGAGGTARLLDPQSASCAPSPGPHVTLQLPVDATISGTTRHRAFFLLEMRWLKWSEPRRPGVLAVGPRRAPLQPEPFPRGITPQRAAEQPGPCGGGLCSCAP